MIDDEDLGDWDDDADPWDEDEPVVACPYCGQDVHEESQRCPYCEQYISQEDSAQPSKPWWIILGAVAALYAALRWIL